MILINTAEKDPATDQVIRWLMRLNATFKRLNNEVFIKDIEFINNAFVVHLEDGTSIDFSAISAYWYRRGEYILKQERVNSGIEEFDGEYNFYFQKEIRSVLEFFQHNLKRNIYSIGNSITCINVNKNSILLLAKEYGLGIPDTLITGRRDTALQFVKKHGRAITKPVFLPYTRPINDNLYPTFTEMVDETHLLSMPETFKTSLFQQYLDKKIELRVFYIDGEFYPMAIFSQNDQQTSIDFRHYNHGRPNRTVPFALPEDVKVKLTGLMKKLDFESGSIDLIYGQDKQFYFLEVNPVGQFGMVSYPCNYYLERNIAHKLAITKTYSYGTN